MAYISMNTNQDLISFDSHISQLGINLNSAYKKARPFPHIVIDNFIPPETLEKILEKFPKSTSNNISYHRPQESNKKEFNPDELSDNYSKCLFYSFNAKPFLQFLENLTGIKGLVPDPYFIGGGFHETTTGGHLGIHADFTGHPFLQYRRRINLILYLNKGWKQKFGGQLELWDKEMTQREVVIDPDFNRCVIFNTDTNTFHGHPDPLNTPKSITRKSIALYYYTLQDPSHINKNRHTTTFKARKNTSDKIDYKLKFQIFLNETMPPILLRGLKKLLRNN